MRSESTSRRKALLGLDRSRQVVEDLDSVPRPVALGLIGVREAAATQEPHEPKAGNSIEVRRARHTQMIPVPPDEVRAAGEPCVSARPLTTSPEIVASRSGSVRSGSDNFALEMEGFSRKSP
jgi:hypothetical protein